MDKTYRILVADDDKHVRDLLKIMLNRLGHEVETASDGFEALAALAFDIDLILLDVMMPGGGWSPCVHWQAPFGPPGCDDARHGWL